MVCWKELVWHTGRSKQFGCACQKAGDISWDSARRNLFCQETNQVSGMTHGDDFVLKRPTERLTKIENTTTQGVSNQRKIHQLRVNGKHQSIEQKNGKARKCVSARSQTCRRARERPRARARKLRVNTSNARRVRRRARAVGPSSTQQIQVASCEMIVPQSRSSGHNIHCARIMSKNAKPHVTEPCQVEDGLKRGRQWEQRFGHGRMVEEVTTYSGSDWASCEETRKSSSASVTMLGRHTLKAHTRQQKLIARSSTEAKLHAATWGETNCVVVEGSRLRDEASARR